MTADLRTTPERRVTPPLRMTAARWLAAAVGVPVALAIIGWTSLDLVALAGQGSFPVRLSIPAGSGRESLDIGNADVSVSSGAAGQLRVTGMARYSLVRARVSWQVRPSGLTIHSSCPVPIGICSFNYAVTVPAGSGADLNGVSGDLSATGITGTTTMSDQSGEIRGTALHGNVAVSDASGDISITGVAGPALVVKDQSGGISASAVADPDVTVVNESGDITVTFTKIPRRVEITDQSGDIRVVLPPGDTTYQVNAVTSSGGTAITVPRSQSSPYQITVTNQSGDITIS